MPVGVSNAANGDAGSNTSPMFGPMFEFGFKIADGMDWNAGAVPNSMFAIAGGRESRSEQPYIFWILAKSTGLKSRAEPITAYKLLL